MSLIPDLTSLPHDDHTAEAPADVEMGMDIIRHVDDTEHRLMSYISDIGKRLDTTTAEIRKSQADDLRYLNDRINTVEKNLTDKLDTQTKDIDENIGEHFKNLGTKMDQNFTKLDKRITVLERWQWLIVGGSGVVMFLIANYLLRYLNIITTP